jgi:hypothetical protein
MFTSILAKKAIFIITVCGVRQLLRTRVNHEISDLEHRGRLGRLENFDQRLFAETRIAGTYINGIRKWRMKRISFHTELLNPARGTSHRIDVMVVKVRGEGTNLNDVETSPTDRFQTIKDTILVKTTVDRPTGQSLMGPPI